MATSDTAIDMLRHTVAALAYRANKALSGAPEHFATFGGAPTPVHILAHMGDLFDWALSLADGRNDWHTAKPLAWDLEVARFFAGIEAFDQRLTSDAALACAPERLFQGPVADALTHTGQVAMLRRLAGCPIKGENYFKADIAAGRLGIDQPTPSVEF